MKIISPLVKEQYLSDELDLNEHIIKHPAATFFVRVDGDEMKAFGIHSDDILVVDRSITPMSGKIIVCILRGEFIVRKLLLTEDKIILQQGNHRISQEKISTSSSDFEIWGVVTYVIHKC